MQARPHMLGSWQELRKLFMSNFLIMKKVLYSLLYQTNSSHHRAPRAVLKQRATRDAF